MPAGLLYVPSHIRHETAGVDIFPGTYGKRCFQTETGQLRLPENA